MSHVLAHPIRGFVGRFVGGFVGGFVGIFVGRFVGRFVGELVATLVCDGSHRTLQHNYQQSVTVSGPRIWFSFLRLQSSAHHQLANLPILLPVLIRLENFETILTTSRFAMQNMMPSSRNHYVSSAVSLSHLRRGKDSGRLI